MEVEATNDSLEIEGVAVDLTNNELLVALDGRVVRVINKQPVDTWLYNQEAQDYLHLVRALEILKLEYKELRMANGNSGMPRTNKDELNFRIVVITMEYIVDEALWAWLETTP